MFLFRNLLKKYFSSFVYFYRFLRYRILIVLSLSVAVGTLDAFGLTMFLPLLELADGSNTASGKGLGHLSFIVNGLNAIGIEITLIVALLILLIFFSLKGLMQYFSLSYNAVVSQYFISTLRLRLTNLFTHYSFKAFVSSDMGHIQNAFTNEVSRVNTAYKAYSDGIQQLIMTFIYMLFVVLIDWKFAILVMIGGLIANLAYSSIYKKTKKESALLTKHNTGFHKAIIQYIHNFKYLKATGFLSNYSQKLQDSIKRIESTNKRIEILNAVISSTREPMMIAVVVLVIILQIYIFNGKLSTILMSLLLFYRALNQLMNFQKSYNSFLANSGSIDNIIGFENSLVLSTEKDGAVEFDTFQEEIQLDKVNFGYKQNDLILKNINLHILKNKSIAFVGESGSGKTTLVNLISGLLPITSGNLSIDKQNINNLKKETYQKRIGYIAQEPVVFNDTIFNNITFWAEPTNNNFKRFQKAIEQAAIKEFIDNLDKKELTLLGNNGINLSGGQKQRISIARELYKEIDILFLDEATSALDSETEKEIQYNIDKLKGKYTIIIIAHRLSTVKNVDTLYLMDKGAIIDNGTFDELLEKSNRFKRMVELQDIIN